ncbi:hypothetical protein TKK_0015464 [Trichogramma kaykai]
MSDDLARVSRWADENGLTINAKKTQTIWFGSRRYVRRIRAAALPPVRLCGESLAPCDDVKILGCVLDETLTWQEHTNFTAAKCFAALARVRRVVDFLPRRTRLMVVKSLVFPHLDYGARLMAGLSDELSTRLQRCQNAAVRFVTGVSRFEHITPSYVELWILKLERRRGLLSLGLLASVLRHGAPAYLAVRFSSWSDNAARSSRRSDLDLSLPDVIRTCCFEHSFYIHTAQLWNALPQGLRLLYRGSCFGRALRELFLSA